MATGNDTDADRHGIVTPDGGLLNPNHYLAVAIDYLYRHRDGWPAAAAVGKTLVSSSMIDRVTERAWAGSCSRCRSGSSGSCRGCWTARSAFGGEESAGASFLQRDGSVWTTDKDGIILALLASEITAVTGQSPSALYRGLTARYGDPVYARIDTAATREQKAALARLSPDQVTASELAGEKIIAALTTAPGNGAPIGGLKVVTASGWFAARPSGTEDVYKLYAESFRGPEHLAAIQDAGAGDHRGGHRLSRPARTGQRTRRQMTDSQGRRRRPGGGPSGAWPVRLLSTTAALRPAAVQRQRRADHLGGEVGRDQQLGVGAAAQEGPDRRVVGQQQLEVAVGDHRHRRAAAR